MVRQYGSGARILPSPLAGEAWLRDGQRSRVAAMRGYASIESDPHPVTLSRDAAGHSRSDPPPQGERVRENYTDAVVTPPSTTMVWPVMKLEASEPR